MASGALEKTALEAKDREQLTAIASALGVKSASRAKKSELIDMILEQTKPAAPTPVPMATICPRIFQACAWLCWRTLWRAVTWPTS